MMMSCEQVLHELSNYLDNEVAPELRADIEAHLRQCKRCSVLYDSVRKMLYIIGDERVFHVPAGYSERLHQFLDRHLEAETSGSD